MPALRGVGAAYLSAQVQVEEWAQLRVEVRAEQRVVERDVTLEVREG